MESTLPVIPSMECKSPTTEAPESHKFTSIISKLEKQTGDWLSDELPLYKYKGFWYNESFLEGYLEAQELISGPSADFSLSSSDVIICSSMKSGVTWLKSLAFSIVTRTRFDPFSMDHPLLKTVPHDLLPLIEIDFGNKHTPRDPDLPLLSTHLPYSALPNPILSLGCKIVYICRNPKDVFVSMWHFIQNTGWGKEDPVLDEACDLFCKGVSLNGPYWDHVLEYWKASLDHPDKVMFLKYEDMMIDAEFYVKALASFMGYPFSKEEEREGVANKIVEICRFENLSALEVNQTGRYGYGKKMIAENDASIPNSSFFRKGGVDDWKNYLNEDMATKFDGITLEKLGDFGLKL